MLAQVERCTFVVFAQEGERFPDMLIVARQFYTAVFIGAGSDQNVMEALIF